MTQLKYNPKTKLGRRFIKQLKTRSTVYHIPKSKIWKNLPENFYLEDVIQIQTLTFSFTIPNEKKRHKRSKKVKADY